MDNELGITKEQFLTWSQDIEKLFLGETKNLYYTPFRSITIEVVQLDDIVANKKIKINTKGILYEYYEYLRTELKQHNSLDHEEEQRAVERLGTHLGLPDIVKSAWKKSYPSREIILRKGCTITEYFRRFPTLKGALNDFKRRYPHAESTLYNSWDCARDIIKTALADCTKLKGIDLGYYSALPALGLHNRHSVLFHLLPQALNIDIINRGSMNGVNVPQPHLDVNNGEDVENNELIVSFTDGSDDESVISDVISSNNMLKERCHFPKELMLSNKKPILTARKKNEPIAKELSGIYSLDKKWKQYVREVLLEVHGNQLPSYTVNGSRGTPLIAVQLFRGLHPNYNTISND
ncbi:hypothetical protein PV328_004248 [Microctonus aethiopoides]|uniref:Uncharacterized protein n=1 Tax=Microctonus aethiopoides TaxID=144406 RepID=A0AA39FA43_9HYME|nr:hypothetical protein PV328_004248 [Microctonus aethiopoides]